MEFLKELVTKMITKEGIWCILCIILMYNQYDRTNQQATRLTSLERWVRIELVSALKSSSRASINHTATMIKFMEFRTNADKYYNHSGRVAGPQYDGIILRHPASQ